MSFLGTLSKLIRRQPLRDKRSVAPTTPQQIRAAATSYDAIVKDHNLPYWSRSSGADANQTATPEVRRRLRNQARLEVGNASYAEGIIETLANDTIGTGPRLQIIPERPEQQQAANRLERIWDDWSEEVQLAESMHTSKRAKTIDGEAFGLMQTDMALEHPVKLTWRLYECDFFQEPWDLQMYWQTDARYPPYDGIVFDQWGNPAFYYKTKRHPGSLAPYYLGSADFDLVPARYVSHLYRVDRPGQARGVCEIQSVLNLFKDLRDFAQSTVLASDRAARMSGVIHSDMPPGEADEIEGGPCQKIDIPIDALLNLPDGYEATQLKAGQPVDTFREFTNTIIREIARCIQMPFNIAAGDSGEMNYASARLDMQTYHRSITVERRYYERKCLEPIFRQWFEEATFLGIVPRIGANFRKRWHWDGRPHVDPAKEAQAIATLFNNGLLDEASYWSELYGMGVDEAHDRLEYATNERKRRDLPLQQNIITFEAQTPQDELADGAETDEE